MAFQDVMHTSNPVYKYAFSWKIDNVADTPLQQMIQGPIFQPVPGYPRKFRFGVAAREVTELLSHPDYPRMCDLCLSDDCKCTETVTVLDMKLISLDNNDLHLNVVVDIALFAGDKLLCTNYYGINKVEETTTLGCFSPFKLSDVNYCQLTLKGTLQFSGFQVTSTNYPFSVQQPMKNVEELSKDLKTMYESGFGSDVTFSVGEETLRAHKAILNCRSPVFAKMFAQDMLENNTNNVIIEDTDYRTFNRFLMFIYSGSLELDDKYETIVSLFAVAHKYQVKSLQKTCILLLTKQLTTESVWCVLALADLYGDEELKNVVKVFIRENFFDISNSAKWHEVLKTNSKLAIDVMSCITPIDNSNEV